MVNLLESLSIFNLNSQIAQDDYLIKNNIILFKFQTYCPLFVEKLHHYLKNIKFEIESQNILTIDIENIKLNELEIKLNNNFLGQKILYILKNMPILDNTKKNAVYNCIQKYNGQNIIFIFDENTNNSNNFLIFNIPANLNEQLYNKYYNFFYPDYKINNLFIKKLFKYNQTILLDLAINIMMYQSILSNKNNDFFENWLPKLINLEKSIFDLSHYFFDKQIKNFFELWLKYKIYYPIEFWISFWSDQIWQANIIVKIANKYGILKAQKLASRLPFSFINKNYANYKSLFLTKAHCELYKIDFNFKNDLGYNEIELWFSKFLLNRF